MDWDYTFVAIDGGRYSSCQCRDRGEREEANRRSCPRHPPSQPEAGKFLSRKIADCSETPQPLPKPF